MNDGSLIFVCSEPKSYSELMDEKFGVEGFMVREHLIYSKLAYNRCSSLRMVISNVLENE